MCVCVWWAGGRNGVEGGEAREGRMCEVEGGEGREERVCVRWEENGSEERG